MKTNITWARILLSSVVLAAVSLARAEDVAKKFRIGLAVGTYDTASEVRSDSENILQLVRADGSLGDSYEDPRNDAAAIGSLQIETAPRVTVSGQYAFNKILVLEGSVGYQKGQVGSIETQAQFDGEIFDTTRQRFNFHIYDLRAGTMTQVPIQVTALARFRPKSTFNPYFGAGGGYTYVGFEPSDQLNTLSVNMDRSTGLFARQETFPGGFNVDTSSPPVQLSGATVSAPDTVEWHLTGGAEFGFRKKWSAFLDARYTFASGDFHIGFNGADSIGVSVPNGLQEQNSIFGTTAYGTYSIRPGLIDGGCFVSTLDVVAHAGGQVSCSPSCAAGQCVFVPTGTNGVKIARDAPPIQVTLPQSDGIPDPGFYYVQGGKINYGGFSIQIGIRYTF